MRVSLEIPFELNEVIRAIGGFTAEPIENRMIYGVTTDTREMERGDLFFALCGERFDGEDFCYAAAHAGCICISRSYRGGIQVGNTQAALSALAAYYKTKLTSLKKVVGITGSVGKTTAKEFLHSILSGSMRVHATEGNYNNAIGVAHAILSCKRDAEVLIVEMGMNHSGEIRDSSLTARPDVAVITSIGTSHIGNLGSREMIARAKMEITEGLSERGTLIIPYCENTLKPNCRYKTVSTDSEDADLSLIPLESSTAGTSLVLRQKGAPPTVASVSIFGEANIRALAFATACSLELGLSRENIARAFSRISRNNTRQKIIHWQNRCIIDDSYNASLESVVAAFEMMRLFSGRRCAVLGDILELGSSTEAIHFKIGAEAFARGIERLFLIGVYAPFIARGALCAGMDRSHIFINSDPASPEITEACIREKTSDGDVILFKASHKSRLYDMIERITTDEKEEYAR